MPHINLLLLFMTN